MYPFVGSRLEIVTTLGVRYQGRLKGVNSSDRSIILDRIQHFGTEDRHTGEGPHVEAKGELPEADVRLIHYVYIAGWRRLDSKQAIPTYGHLAWPPAAPLYFIAQAHGKVNGHEITVGLLMNAGECADAPGYIQFETEQFPSPADGVCVTQVWRVPHYESLLKMAHKRMINAHFRDGDHSGGLSVFCREKQGCPWMVNRMLAPQAVAKSEGLELVEDAEYMTVKGVVAKVEKGYVEVRAAGRAVDGVRLGPLQYEGKCPFKRLTEGVSVSVKMVRLREGSWVGARYVLPPNADYADDRAPFTPSEALDEEGRVTRSDSGDFYPIHISYLSPLRRNR